MPNNTPDTALEPVEPAEPIAAWFGGKKYLAKRIAARIEAVPHTCYAEPFCGMAGVFLRRSRRPKSEILNDINADVVNLYRVVREHPDELVRQFGWVLSARAEFERLIEIPPETLTDVQRAARFAFLQTVMFAGKPATMGSRGTVSVSAYHPAKLTAARLRRLVSRAHRRLQGVHIERLDWRTFLRRHDKPFTLFYIDPPYFGHENDYGKGLFEREDFARMAELLRGLRGRFILSLNDRPEVREIFSGFQIEAVETLYSPNARSTRRVGELLISGGGGGGRSVTTSSVSTMWEVHTTLPTMRNASPHGSASNAALSAAATHPSGVSRARRTVSSGTPST